VPYRLKVQEINRPGDIDIRESEASRERLLTRKGLTGLDFGGKFPEWVVSRS
jgi:hypothetical protein